MGNPHEAQPNEQIYMRSSRGSMAGVSIRLLDMVGAMVSAASGKGCWLALQGWMLGIMTVVFTGKPKGWTEILAGGHQDVSSHRFWGY